MFHFSLLTTNPSVIVIGSSAAGVTALQKLIAGLPFDFKVPVLNVQHLPADTRSFLPEILTNAGSLPAYHSRDGQLMVPGHIYVAPPDHHLLLENKHLMVKKGPKENRFRPSIDALMRSAAFSHGAGVIGVILTGMLDDGTSGMWSVQRMGGTTIVQDPMDAMYPSMPSSVLQYVDVDYSLPLDQISSLLIELTNKAMKSKQAGSDAERQRLKLDTEVSAQDNGFEHGILNIGEPSHFTCPDCGGAMIQIREGSLIRFKCHTGHGFSPATLLYEVRETIEKKLWQSLRSLEESIMLLNITSEGLAQAGNLEAAAEMKTKAETAIKSTKALRVYIFEHLFKQDQTGNVDLSGDH